MIDELLTLVDANSGDTPHPYLFFDLTCGVIAIADDCEIENDPTARDFVLSSEDAIRLAAMLLLYAQYGKASHHKSVSRIDIEDRLKNRR